MLNSFRLSHLAIFTTPCGSVKVVNTRRSKVNRLWWSTPTPVSLRSAHDGLFIMNLSSPLKSSCDRCVENLFLLLEWCHELYLVVCMLLTGLNAVKFLSRNTQLLLCHLKFSKVHPGAYVNVTCHQWDSHVFLVVCSSAQFPVKAIAVWSYYIYCVLLPSLFESTTFCLNNFVRNWCQFCYKWKRREQKMLGMSLKERITATEQQFKLQMREGVATWVFGPRQIRI